MPSPKKSVVFGGALPFTVTLLLLLATLSLPSHVGSLIILLLAIGWIFAALRWTLVRFGRVGVVIVAVVAVTVGGLIATVYWLDGPNRRLVAQIEQLPGCAAATTGRLLTGDVDHVYIGSRASDKEVWPGWATGTAPWTWLCACAVRTPIKTLRIRR